MANLERLIQAIDYAEQSAYGSETDSDLQTDRAIAIDLYHGKNIEPAPDGRSQVVDRTVFETVQWIMPSLARIFANGDDIVEFQPFGPEDEGPAKQESDYLNYIVTQKNPWPVIFNTWGMDALLSKNGYCEPYIEERLQTELETYEKQSEDALALLLQDEGVQVVAHEAVEDPTQQEVVGVDPMGQPVMAPRQLHTVTLKRTKPSKKLCFKVIPPERTKVDIDTDSFSLEHSNYFEYWDVVTISSLRSLGFDVDDDIASGLEDNDDTEEGRARDLYSEETFGRDSSSDVDPSMRKVRFRCIWIRHDTDEDGIAELQKCYRVGETILERYGEPAIYPCSRVGVACITPNINPHRHIGTSEADITIDIQRIKTAILRQGLDGLYLSTNPQQIVSNEVHIEDFMVTRPGGLKRMKEGSAALPGEGHVMPLVTQNVFPDAVAGLEYMAQVHESRTGVSRAFSGVDPSTLNKGNSSGVAINQLSTMASQRIEQIARVFSVGVQYLFSVAHELIIKSGHKPEVVKLRGKWETIDPSTWKTGRDMRLVVGYGAGNKDALVSRLMLIANMQKEMLVGGLPTVTPENVYATAIEVAKASDFSAPQRFFTDPRTMPPPAPPQPTPDAQLAAQVEGERIQSGERIKKAELELDLQKTQATLLQRDQEAELEARVKLILEEMKGGASVDLERVRGAIKNEPAERGNQQIAALTKSQESAKAELTKFLGDFASKHELSIKQLTDMLNAPREVVRGKDGRVSGVKIGGVERKVKRDSGGRVTGLQ